MKIPTILSEDNIHTGSTGPQASPEDFGESVGASFGRVAGSLSRVSSQFDELAKAQKHFEDVTWVGKEVERRKNEVNDFMADPKNNSKETYPQDLKGFMDDQLSQYSGDNVPSTRALALLKQHMYEYGGTAYRSSVHTAAQNKMNNAALGIDQMSGNLMDSYRLARDIPWMDSAQDLKDGIDRISSNIDETFGTISPTLAQKLKEKLVVDGTYASMRDDPKLASQILDKSKTLDEHSRYTIQQHIESSSRTRSAVEIEAFKQRREDQFAAVQFEKSRDKIPLTEYKAYYDDDHARALKMRDDSVIDTINRTNDSYNTIKGFNANSQFTELQKFQDRAKDEQDREVLQALSQKVHQNVQMQERDPVGWMQTNNNFVRDALNRASKSTDNQRVQSMKELYDVALKFQGPPPVGEEVLNHGLTPVKDERTGMWNMVSGSSSVDPRLYLDVPTNNKHLMSAQEAERNADTINRGSPKEVLNAINRVMQSYPDERHQNIAFMDMVNLPKSGRGIKQEYQLAFLNQGAPWIDNYLGSIANSESIKGVQPDKRKDFDDALKADKTWMAFSHSVMGDNFQRGDQVDGVKNGILTYAYAKATRDGLTPKSAVQSSITELIGSERGFANVNGQTLMIARDAGPHSPPRNDADMAIIGKNLEQSLQYIDPKEIKLEDERGRSLFPPLNTPGLSSHAKNEAVRNALMMHGMFQTSADGNSATLYYNDGGNHFELRDKQNRAFRINFKDVQDPMIWFGTHLVRGWDIDDPHHRPTPLKDPIEVPYGKYPLYGITGDSTNFPVLPWIERMPR